ncbi:unnamed protein product [Orchesella dallaii]|uniref:Uncharacterized protein n=1 Tax=Orchesella dallaii TaxID=48710 RepID=A0ABP1PLY7_9HEXA
MIAKQLIDFLVLCVINSFIFLQTKGNQAQNLPDCLIHILYGEEIVFTTKDESNRSVIRQLFNTKIALTFTTQQIHDYSFLPGSNNTDYLDNDFEPGDTKIDSKSGYLRFTSKLSSVCTIFLVKAQSTNETIIAIQRSGHGTSDNVLFLIEISSLSTENEVLQDISEELFNSEGMPFHAPIAFFNLQTQEFISFCYFCPTKFSRFQNLETGTKNTWMALHSENLRVNQNGYGTSVFIPSPFSLGHNKKENCFKNYQGGRSRSNLFGEHVNCSLEDLWLVAPIQTILNISLTLKSLNQRSSHQKWMLQIRYGEGTLQMIPNIYIYTRGSVIIIENFVVDLMGCIPTEQLQTFEFSVFTALDYSSWGSLLLLILICCFVFQNVWKGLDFFGTFLGRELTQKHVRFQVCIILVGFSILSYVYASTLSAESMQLMDFPAFKTLIKRGYRFWMGETLTVSVILRSVSNWTKNGLKRHLGADMDDPKLFFVGKGNLKIQRYYSNNLKMLSLAAKYKLFITSITSFDMFKVIGKRLISVNENLICKVGRTSGDVELSFDHTIRIWGYLSNRFAQLIASMLSSGEYVRLRSLKQVNVGNEMKNMEMSNAVAFSKPKPITLNSVVGLIDGSAALMVDILISETLSENQN